MPLTTGLRIGSYEIKAPLGEGGMGVVYRAHDTKLGRDVAIKALPDAFANDSDRLQRFQREAQVLASLNHPNIAHIYGLEQAEGTQCIVMELVEGETLHEQLKRGPIPVKSGSIELAHDGQHGRDKRRSDFGNGRVHVSRASTRNDGRSAHRHLRVWCGAV